MIVYTIDYCPFCVRAKKLLQSKNVLFEERNLSGKDEELSALQERTKMRTVPQIFIGDELVGGFQELQALENAGQLDAKLQE